MESIVQAKRVLEIFKEMSQIPRESGKRKGISDYIVNFAKNLGFEVHQDDQFNVVIKSQRLQVMKTDLLSSYKAISIWFVFEIMTPIMTFQGPIANIIEGEWMHADHTTLGADNGMGGRMMLCHPRR